MLEEQADKAIEKVDENAPFAGVPFLIKELVLHAEGVLHSMGSRIGENTIIPVDSELMARFRKAGLILAGTTTTPEFGYNAATEAVIYGATRNPWNLNHSPWFEWHQQQLLRVVLCQSLMPMMAVVLFVFPLPVVG